MTINLLSLIPIPYRILLLVAFLVATIFFGWIEGSKHVQAKWDLAVAKQAALDKSVAITAISTALTKQQFAENQHDKDQKVINAMQHKLAADSMYIPIPISACVPKITITGPSSDAASGVLPSTVERAFAELQNGASKLFGECDQMNIDVIRSNTASN